MKKLMIGLAAAGLCGAVFADVTSANIVGYTTTQKVIPGYWYIMSASFENISDPNMEYPIADLVKGDITAGETMETSARVQVRVAGVAYGYWYNAKGNRTFVPGQGFVYSPAWCVDGSTEVASDARIKNGQGFWFIEPYKESTVTVSGQVVNQAKKSWPAGVYWDLACNPYPVAIGLNSDKLDCSQLTAGETMETSARIQVRVDGVAYGYWYNAKGNRTFVPGQGFVYSPAWCVDGSTEVASDAEIAIGQGFWLQNPTDGAELGFNF